MIVKVDSHSCPKSVRQYQLHQPQQTGTLRYKGEETGTIGSCQCGWRVHLCCLWLLLSHSCQTSLGSSTPKFPPHQILASFLVVCFLPASLRNKLIRFPGNVASGLLPRTEYVALPHKRVLPKPFMGNWVPCPLFIIVVVWAALQFLVVSWDPIKPSNWQNVLTKVFHYMKVGAHRPTTDITTEIFVVCFSSRRLPIGL